MKYFIAPPHVHTLLMCAHAAYYLVWMAEESAVDNDGFN